MEVKGTRMTSISAMFGLSFIQFVPTAAAPGYRVFKSKAALGES